MIEEFKIKDGRVVFIKRLTMDDYKINKNYEYVHSWLNQVNKYLALEFDKENLEQDRRNFEIIMSNKDNYIMIGAIYNEKIIASANLELNLRNKKMGHIGKWGIAIHPKFQNKGLGTRLLLIIENIAKEKGLKKLETEYFNSNVKAEKLYVEKLKYQIEGRRKCGAKLKEGIYTNRILIGKIIDDSLK
ncbi:MAG: GNAT family N-acetyltransferase [Candidatus Thorarchaeota archaeon]